MIRASAHTHDKKIPVGSYCPACQSIWDTKGDLLVPTNQGRLFKKVIIEGPAFVRDPGDREPDRVDRERFKKDLKKEIS